MYFITTIYIKDNNLKKSRCVGYYNDKNDAIKVLNDNFGDLYECGYYNFAVIEKVEEGIYRYDSNPIWFKWNKKKEGFFKTKKPACTKSLVGFCMC